jgi:hypothetical protein
VNIPNSLLSVNPILLKGKRRGGKKDNNNNNNNNNNNKKKKKNETSQFQPRVVPKLRGAACSCSLCMAGRECHGS